MNLVYEYQMLSFESRIYQQGDQYYELIWDDDGVLDIYRSPDLCRCPIWDEHDIVTGHRFEAGRRDTHHELIPGSYQIIAIRRRIDTATWQASRNTPQALVLEAML